MCVCVHRNKDRDRDRQTDRQKTHRQTELPTGVGVNITHAALFKGQKSVRFSETKITGACDSHEVLVTEFRSSGRRKHTIYHQATFQTLYLHLFMH